MSDPLNAGMEAMRAGDLARAASHAPASGPAWPALDTSQAEGAPTYDDLWAAATTTGGAASQPRQDAPQAAGPPVAPPEAADEAAADDEFAEVEDAARARA